jgi:nucleoside-diphosphate-sugar epimerase
VSTAEQFAITGASGFIGGRLCAALTANGHPIARLQRAPGGSALASVRTVVGDLADAPALKELVRGARFVVHAAAHVHRRSRSDKEDRLMHEVNVEGTRRLLEACRSEASPPFVILLSSVAVFGPTQQLVDERQPCNPHTAYGRSKLEAEQALLHEIKRGSLRGCVLRPCAVFGDGCPGNLALLARCIRAGVLPLVDGGQNRRSLTHVSTVVDAIRWLASRELSANGQVFILADDESYPIVSIAEWVARAQGRKPWKIPLPSALLRPPLRRLDAWSRHLPLPSLLALFDAYSGSAEYSNARLRATGFAVARPTPSVLPSMVF